jgi:hypothetical protein
MRDVVGLFEAGPQRTRVLRPDGLATAEWITLAKLAKDRPGFEELREPHAGALSAASYDKRIGIRYSL